MKWGSQQDATLKGVSNWFNDPNKKQVYRVFGYAGTGKTSLAKYFRESISGEVCYGAFTGKAASVMRKNGCENASTIHSMIYTPIINEYTGEVTFSFNPTSMIAAASLIIIDECSMVDNDMANDLLSYGVPILVLGDPAQLPPVKGEGFFTNAEPDHMLTEIHRQALDNPIIYMSSKVRENKKLKPGAYGDSIVTNKYLKRDVMSADQILCGKNLTRKVMNSNIRKVLKYEGLLPNKGESLICLRNKNNRKTGEKLYFNGGMYEVASVEDKGKYHNSFSCRVISKDDGTQTTAKIFKYIFDESNYEQPDWKTLAKGVEFDYGYCITTHKSQGSQWDYVYVIDESDVFGEFQSRWLYTAITRASERVTLFSE
jgi:exodeoxyribonuclease-5